MNKVELKLMAEQYINPINVVTQFGFKLYVIEQKFEWDLEDNTDYEHVSFGFNTNIKSHYIGLQIEPYTKNFKYHIWYNNHDGGRVMRESFKSELELCVFLKQSKFKIK